MSMAIFICEYIDYTDIKLIKFKNPQIFENLHWKKFIFTSPTLSFLKVIENS